MNLLPPVRFVSHQRDKFCPIHKKVLQSTRLQRT
jgi:hypothetical protein